MSSSSTAVEAKYRATAELLRRQKKCEREAAIIKVALLPWMIEHRPYLIPERRFDLRNHPYLEAVYQSCDQEVVLYKAGQMGISEYLISYALHACDQRAATVLYIFPTDTHVSDFSAARLGPAIEASEYLQSIIIDGTGVDGKRGSDKVTLKRIRDRFMYFRGGSVSKDGRSPSLKSVDADILIFDELDEIDPRAPGIARKRLGHSQIGEIRYASTPTYPGVGIHVEWLKSDQREWFIRCPHCGKQQNPTIQHLVLDYDALGRPKAWHGQAAGKPFLSCDRCGKPLDLAMPGEWVAQAESDLVGFHITKLIAPLSDLGEIIKNLSSTDETSRKEAFNQDLALPYTPRGGSLDDAILDTCRREYAHGPQAEVTCYMGVDVGKVLHVVCRAAPDGEKGERKQLYAGVVATFEELGRLIERYRPRTVVIDALPETHKVRELRTEFRRNQIWIAYYGAQKVGSKKEDSIAWDRREFTATIDRTRLMDETMARFQDNVNTLPGDARSIKEYYSQLKAPVRVIEKDAAGIEVARYVETGADHFAHAENYCTAASMCPVGLGWAR